MTISRRKPEDYNTQYSAVKMGAYHHIMSYQCFIIEPQDYAYYPEIPEYYTRRFDEVTLIMGAADEEDSRTAALMIGTVSAADDKIAHIPYVWCKSRSGAKEILSELLPAYIRELKVRGYKKICFRVAELKNNTYGYLTKSMLEEAGAVKTDRPEEAAGYILSDFYDTLFMRSDAIKASQNTHLLSFGACSKEECRKYLDKLFKEVSQKDMSLIPYSPFSFFYMEKNTPVGVMTMEYYGRSGCIVDGVYIKDTASAGKVFRALLAGAFSGALSGMGMQSCIFARFSVKEYFKFMEECLGEQSFSAAISDHEYDL